jgi:hypothetical protein
MHAVCATFAGLGDDVTARMRQHQAPGHPRSPVRRRLLASLAGLAGALAFATDRGLAQEIEAPESPLSPPTVSANGSRGTESTDPRLGAASTVADARALPLADRLRIEQRPAFTQPVSAALNEITKLPDASWAEFIAGNLVQVRLAQPGELPEGASAGMLVGADGSYRGGTAIIAPMRTDIYYLASIIAHEAWHYHQYRGGGVYYGRAAEQEAIRAQIDVLRSMMPSHYGLGHLEQSLATVGDGGPLPGNPRRD